MATTFTAQEQKAEAILREYLQNMDTIFADWRRLCRQHGWKSGLKGD